LGEIIRNVSKMSIEEFSFHYLFEPLGIDSSKWDSKFENGVIYAGGGLKITPRDMPKIRLQ
jgi:CubicO group peptidase (beta-lactamase class C family)